MHRKRLWLIAPLLSASVFFAGCGSTSTSLVWFDGLQISVPQTYIALNSSQLDSYQIINKILKAYKDGTRTLIIARSALNANLTPAEYATASTEKVAQGIPGYTHIDDDTQNFTCWKTTVKGYEHFFSVSDAAQDNPWKTYIAQYYFISNSTAYIISEADRSDVHYSDFTSLIDSLHCN